MKILFISLSETAEDKFTWSGTVFKTYQALKTQFGEMDYYCAQQGNDLFGKVLLNFWYFVIRKMKKNVCLGDTYYGYRMFRKSLKHLDYSRYDLIVVPGFAPIVAALPDRIRTPIVYISDATFQSLLDYYPENCNLLGWNRFTGNLISKKAYNRAARVVVCSDWARKNGIADYGVAPERLKVVELGANIEERDIPAHPKSLDGKKRLNLFLSGVHWERKGGDTAVEAVARLRETGHDCVLHIAGMEIPERYRDLPYVRGYGFLNKNNPEEYRKYIELMNEMDLFIFPTKAECAGIVLCEAAGFGMPAFTYRTGGTGNYVVEGCNGYLLPPEADGRAYAERIARCIESRELDALSKRAKALYADKLNWTRWGERVRAIVEEAVRNR